jgi:hypothetical protein
MMIGDKLHTKKQRKYTCYAHDLKVNINFKRQNKLSKTFTQLDEIIPLKYCIEIYKCFWNIVTKISHWSKIYLDGLLHTNKY